MKITTNKADAFVSAPPPDLCAALIYGPDAGMVSERAAVLGRTVVGDLQDPFNAVELTGDALSEDPARLSAEADTGSLMGGRRLIRLRGLRDSQAEIVGDWLAAARPGGNLVVAEAGELPARSALRKVFEGAAHAAAIACYPEEGGDLKRSIADELRRHGLSAQDDALSYLADHLAGDRLQMRMAVEKLITYAGPEPDALTPKQITLDEARACVGDAAAVSLDALCLAAGGGDLAKMQAALRRLFGDGVNAVTVLRAVSRHFLRLHQARAMVDEGKSAKEAVGALRVFWKLQDPMRFQVERWRLSALNAALERLAETEANCKRTGAPAALLCSHTLTALTAAAGKKARR